MDLDIAGRTWRLVFTNRVILDIGNLTGTEAMTLTLGNLNAKLLRAVLFAALAEAGCRLSLEQVGALLIPDDIPRIQYALYRAWIASLPDPDPKKEATGDKPEALSTLDAWARARYNLKLSDEEWLAMTPRMLHALSKCHLDDMRHREMMFAILGAHTVNSSFRAPQTPVQPGVFMQHPWPDDDQAPDELYPPVYGEHILALHKRTTMPDIEPVPLKIGDTELLLRYDFNAIAEAESVTGTNLLLALENLSKLSASQLRGLLYAAIVSEPRPTLAEAGKLIRLDTIAPITFCLSEAYMRKIPDRVSNGTAPAEPKRIK